MNEILTALTHRRSIRCYQDRPVAQDVLDNLLRVGLMAPSAMNQQPWHISAVQSKEVITWMEGKIKKGLALAGDHERAEDPDFHTFYEAPAVLYISGEQSNRFHVGDCANLVTYLALAAYGLGLSSCYIASSQVMFSCPEKQEIKEKLGIPEGYEPLFSLAIGYSQGPVPEPKPRRQDTVTFITR